MAFAYDRPAILRWLWMEMHMRKFGPSPASPRLGPEDKSSQTRAGTTYKVPSNLNG
jgi:hypothetical protein